MNKIGGSVEGVDNPGHKLVVATGPTAFFGQDGMVGESPIDLGEDCRLGGAVGGRDQIVAGFFVDLMRFEGTPERHDRVGPGACDNFHLVEKIFG